MRVVNRTRPGSVALETTLLVHGVPRDASGRLVADLAAAINRVGARPAIVGVVRGRATAGLTAAELDEMLAEADVPKLNTANLGVAMHRGLTGATTASATVEIAAAAGLNLFATGGLGGVHRRYGERLDVSSDLLALARHPVAVVASGVKGILDVAATREALESLGVPVVGYRTDRFPAFYVRRTPLPVDASFDDPADLARFIRAELARTGRGVLVCNPAPEGVAFDEAEFERVLEEAQARVAYEPGRGVTPDLLAALHHVTGGRTLACNTALAVANAELAGRLAISLSRGPTVEPPLPGPAAP